MRGNKFFKFVDKYAGFLLLVILRLISIIPFRSFSKQDKNCLLVVKLSALGDTILLLPILKKIKKQNPGGKVLMVVTEVNKAAVEGCRYIDEIFVLDIKRMKNPFYFFAFTKKLAENKPYFAFDFDQWLRISPLICFFSGAAKRIGFKTKGQHRNFLYTQSVEHAGNKHELDCFFSIIEKAGYKIKPADKELFFDIEPAYEKQAKEKLRQMKIKDRFAVIHPGCGEHGWQRQWDETKYAEIAKYLKKKKYSVIISAGRSEQQICEKIITLAGFDIKNITGEPLKVLAAIIKKSKLFISGNTGIMHLAAAVGARVIALHGPTNPVKWGPLGKNCFVIRKNLDCSPCLYLGFEYGCKGRACMDAIETPDVIKIIEKLH